MALGVYKVPKPFKDEDLWLKFFTKTQLLALGIAGIAGGTVLVLCAKAGLVVIGIVLFLFIVGITGVCFMVNIPQDRYLMGGGEKICIIVYRVMVKRIFRRSVYVKNISGKEV